MVSAVSPCSQHSPEFLQVEIHIQASLREFQVPTQVQCNTFIRGENADRNFGQTGCLKHCFPESAQAIGDTPPVRRLCLFKIPNKAKDLDRVEIPLDPGICASAEHVSIMGERVHPFQFPWNNTAGTEYHDMNLIRCEFGKNRFIKEDMARTFTEGFLHGTGEK